MDPPEGVGALLLGDVFCTRIVEELEQALRSQPRVIELRIVIQEEER